RVVQKLTEQAAASLKQLESCAIERDAERVARIAHGLKGAAAMAAAEPLRQVAAKLEEIGRGKDLAAIDETLARVRAELKRYEEYIQRPAVVTLGAATSGTQKTE